tara:strand:- start:11418 stop:11843 length:426 start_codon:yes stop_codon:yes gene_type:complete
VTDLRVVIAALENFIEDIIKKVALDVVANLVRAPSQGGTPVDTGWARANWLPLIGNNGRADAAPKFDRQARAQNTPAVAAAQQGLIATVATSYKIQQGPIFIINSVRYIVKLDQGTSRQAPPGFVGAAVALAVQQAVRGTR